MRAVVIDGEGEHFCAGLDLSELTERSAARACCIRACGMRRSTRSSSAACRWSRCCTARWSAAGSSWPAPATSASPTSTAYYGLPEGQRGIFVGGGGSVRIPRLIGVARMTDMMLTGRVYDAAGRRARRLVAVRGRRRRGPGQGDRAGRAHRRQRAAVQLRGDARIAAHRRPVAERGPVHRVADGGDGRRARPRPRSACAPSSKARAARCSKNVSAAGR